MRTLYTLLSIFLLPVFVLRLFYRAQKAPAYKQRIGERFAQVPERTGHEKLIWLHAVSVGEVLAAVPLVKALKAQYPEHIFCITTTTPTGSERVRASFGRSVLHYYLPYDLPSLLVHFCRQIRPSALIIMETELWPNVLAVCQYLKIPAILANGRMSERSAKGYQRFASISKAMFKQLDLIAAQSPADAERFMQLGASAQKLIITGSIKFDIAIEPAVQQRLAELKQQLAITDNRQVVIFASTHQGEDERILPIIQRLKQSFPEFLALIVPRHPERFDEVAELAVEQSLDFIRISDKQAVTPNTALIVGDTMGDMLAFYGLAGAAFIGGSLIRHGGHNMLEAALWSLPIISGAYVFNFQSISDTLQQQQALMLVDNEQQLEQQLRAFLNHDAAFAQMGNNAHAVLKANQGALSQLVEAIKPFLAKKKG